ncbi:iron permease FTR1 [Linderina pennispora]|uniref:Iron permease FTR1 n=1 Tax=Linderina pennispora TaxID=61395 RepID=A0A1Y1W3E5_9FUNG|nr:iron permease FTR1 [Linderina pennispora]ORX68050.1 iron permease FTR1 [Linderina pennispora]
MADVFNVAIFFIILRETLEAGMIISVLLAFVKRLFANDPESLKKLRKQIWIGAIIGFAICLVIGAENLWEGIFCLIAVIMITAMGIGMLRSGRMQEKWQSKLGAALQEDSDNKGWRTYIFFHLPFFTVLREGLEAIVFVAGISISTTAKSIPLAVVVGLICGIIIGYLIYRSGNAMTFHWFFVASTALLYLIAAGLMSRGVNFFENYTFAKYAGADPDAGDVINVKQNIWFLDYGNPELTTNSGGWKIFNAILGWNNVASYGTIISYCLYWAALIAYLLYLGITEKMTDRTMSLSANEKSSGEISEDTSDKLQPNVAVLRG